MKSIIQKHQKIFIALIAGFIVCLFISSLISSGNVIRDLLINLSASFFFSIVTILFIEDYLEKRRKADWQKVNKNIYSDLAIVFNDFFTNLIYILAPLDTPRIPISTRAYPRYYGEMVLHYKRNIRDSIKECVSRGSDSSILELQKLCQITSESIWKIMNFKHTDFSSNVIKHLLNFNTAQNYLAGIIAQSQKIKELIVGMQGLTYYENNFMKTNNYVLSGQIDYCLKEFELAYKVLKKESHNKDYKYIFNR
jgi:hypothetical protein